MSQESGMDQGEKRRALDDGELDQVCGGQSAPGVQTGKRVYECSYCGATGNCGGVHDCKEASVSYHTTWNDRASCKKKCADCKYVF